MRIFVNLMTPGNLPRLYVMPGEEALTIENGKVRSALPSTRSDRGANIAYAYERWYVEKHTIWFEHSREIVDQVHDWNHLGPNIDFRPAIREELINEIRLMGMPNVVVFVRHYGVAGASEKGPFFVTLAAGAIGVTCPIVPEGWWFRGPFWESDFERNVDLVLAGEDYPPGMKRYAITPLGRIINPWPKGGFQEIWDESQSKG